MSTGMLTFDQSMSTGLTGMQFYITQQSSPIVTLSIQLCASSVCKILHDMISFQSCGIAERIP